MEPCRRSNAFKERCSGQDLEAAEIELEFGKGWISGVAALALAIGGLFLVISLRFARMY